MRAVVAVAAAAVLLAAAISVQSRRERLFPPVPLEMDAVYVPSEHARRHMAGPYSALAADLYWIRAIQYYGGTKRSLASRAVTAEPPVALANANTNDYSQLYPLLDITTSLDPRFNIAYRFGAVFLAEPYPGGPGRPDLAVALLEKGLRDRPDKWEYMQDIGFVHYWYQHDYRSAAAWFDKGAAVPGAPWWLRTLAATTLAEGGDRRSSRVMWEAIRESAEIDWVRAEAQRRLDQLQALDQLDALQVGIDRFVTEEGTPVTGWQTLLAARALSRIPTDPRGIPYELGSDGRVHLAHTSPLWPPPDEPVRNVSQPASQ